LIIPPNLHEWVALFFRRKWFFVIAALAVLVGGGGYLVWVTPQYRSEAAVVVRFDDKSFPETDMAKDSTATVTAQADRHETVLAHADILTSPDLAREVIEKVGLDVAYPDVVEDPPRVGTPMDEALYTFGKKLVVDPEQQGDVINISFDHPDKKLAQTILKDVLDGYMVRAAEIFSHPDVAFQQAQVDQAKARLEQAQTALRDYKAAFGITSFDDQLAALIKQRTDTNGALQSTEVDLIQSTQHRDELQRLIAKLSPSLVNSASGEKYRSLDDAQTTLDGLLLKERQMRTSYNADSPMLDQLRASIASATADLKARRSEIDRRDSTAPNIVFQNIQTDLLRATADAQANEHAVDALKAQVAALDRQMQALEQHHNGLLERTREVELADDAFRNLSNHLADARVADNRLKDRISQGAVITQPSLPYKVAKPRYLILGVAFLVSSLLIGASAVLVAELLDDRFAGPEQFAHRTGVRVLATFDEPALS
jgi:uncharacterized protein involved in exopolysaccharide biosynthesis